MSRLVDSEGNLKFKTLSLFCLGILTLPHGNAEPERGFSINKTILAVHGFSLKEETPEAFRFVKDFIIKSGGGDEVEVTKELRKSCEASHSRYQFYLSQQKKEEEEEAARKKALEELERRKDETENLERERDILMKSIKVAENCIEEGNLELSAVTMSKTLDREKSIAANTKITMGLKRKSELSQELDELEKKRKILTHSS